MRERKRVNLEALKAKQNSLNVPKIDKNTMYLDFSKYEGEVKFFKLLDSENGNNVINNIDILLFEVTTDKHPDSKDFPVGELDFAIPFSVHKDIGPKNESFICLKETYGKHCPICEERKRLFGINDKANARKIRPQKRILYNVKDLSTGEICVWHVSRNIFTEPMQKQFALVYPKDQAVPFIADLEDGLTIAFISEKETIKNDDGSSFSFSKPNSFNFKERKEPYTEDIIDQTYPLDSFLIVRTAEEMEAALFGYNEENKETETTAMAEEPRKSKRDTTEEKVACPDDFTFGEEYDSEECDLKCPHLEKCKELTKKE